MRIFALGVGAAPFAVLTLAAAAGELSDPTRPPLSLPAAETRSDDETRNLDLRAIFVSEGRRIALINGQRLREGERLGSARVLRIEHDAVVLQRGGKALELRLIGRDVKRDLRLPSSDAAAPQPSKQEDGA